MTWDQWFIAFFSGGGALCINLGGRFYRWGQLLCMIASPCWIISTFYHGQYAMMGVTCWVSSCYVYGVYRSFWRNRHAQAPVV